MAVTLRSVTGRSRSGPPQRQARTPSTSSASSRRMDGTRSGRSSSVSSRCTTRSAPPRPRDGARTGRQPRRSLRCADPVGAVNLLDRVERGRPGCSRLHGHRRDRLRLLTPRRAQAARTAQARRQIPDLAPISRARLKTASSMSSVSLPVKVFCWRTGCSGLDRPRSGRSSRILRLVAAPVSQVVSPRGGDGGRQGEVTSRDARSPQVCVNGARRLVVNGVDVWNHDRT